MYICFEKLLQASYVKLSKAKYNPSNTALTSIKYVFCQTPHIN